VIPADFRPEAGMRGEAMKSKARGEPAHPSAALAGLFVEQALRSRRFPEGDRLPALRILARSAKVSPAHMLSALRRLAAKGLVTIVKNHGTYAGGPEDRLRALDPEALEKPPKEKWQRLRQRLEQDIYAGRFAKGAGLPSLRDLAPRYGTSPPTLRKALSALARAGAVETHGRGYRLPRPAHAAGRAAILFTAWALPEDADLWFRRDRYVEFLASLGRACAEANLRLLISSYHPRHGFRWRSETGASTGGPGGIPLRAHLAWAPTLSGRDLERFCADLARLHKGPKPVRVGSKAMPLAIFDGARGIPMAVPRAKDYAGTRIFSILRRQAGEQVARFLLAAGHRRIAYLSACHHEPWSKDRLQGLKRACEAAGFPDAVRAFTVPAWDDPADKPGLPEAPAIAEAGMAEALGRLDRGLETDVRAWLSMHLRTALGAFRLESRTSYALAEPIGRMKAWRPTACVGANDVMAVTAIHSLRRAGIRVPDDMAFIGFDDDKYAADHNLTSYNFNMAFIAQAMLRYVLAPDKAAPAERDGSVECPGILIERASTGSRE
jgi:DNA-binding LacI/PurR family transcriptional regulator/DNA-binding FadR family transcriptional regulator